MPGFMPYLLDKSSYLSVLESLFENKTKRVDTLTKLKSGVALADLAGFNSTNLGSKTGGANNVGWGDHRDLSDRVTHFNNEWLGKYWDDTQQAWVKRPGYPTGSWQGFEGDPEVILRTAMVAALEV